MFELLLVAAPFFDSEHFLYLDLLPNTASLAASLACGSGEG